MSNQHHTNLQSSDESSSDDEETIKDNRTVNSTNNDVCLVFQHHEMEEKNACVLFQVRKTIRDRIFSLMKFCNEAVLRQVKLKEQNNILHMLLADLNRLDYSEKDRAKFWLRYKSEIRSVLATRKTEVSNHIKEVVYSGKLTMYYIYFNTLY